MRHVDLRGSTLPHDLIENDLDYSRAETRVSETMQALVAHMRSAGQDVNERSLQLEVHDLLETNPDFMLAFISKACCDAARIAMKRQDSTPDAMSSD